MKIVLIILMIIVLACLLIISNNDLAFSNSENISQFGDLFLDWVDKVFLNFKDITGQVTGMDWGP